MIQLNELIEWMVRFDWADNRQLDETRIACWCQHSTIRGESVAR